LPAGRRKNKKKRNFGIPIHARQGGGFIYHDLSVGKKVDRKANGPRGFWEKRGGGLNCTYTAGDLKGGD